MSVRTVYRRDVARPAVLHCAVGSFTVNYCSSPLRHPLCYLHSPTVTMLCVLCLCRSYQLWPWPTSAVQWRCCHVKDFTLATPLFLWSLGTGCRKELDSLVVHRVYFVLTTDPPPCMCGEWAAWIRWVAADSCHMHQWLHIWSTLLHMSGGLLHTGEVQGSPKCIVNCVVWLVNCCCSNMNTVTGMPFEISYIEIKINIVVTGTL